jgi:tetratricopeptide (TPR) repeat protein
MFAHLLLRRFAFVAGLAGMFLVALVSDGRAAADGAPQGSAVTDHAAVIRAYRAALSRTALTDVERGRPHVTARDEAERDRRLLHAASGAIAVGAPDVALSRYLARLSTRAARDTTAVLLRARAHAALSNFREARDALRTLDAAAPDDPDVVRLRTRVLIATDDLARLDSTSATGLARGVAAAHAAYLAARGDLMRTLLRWSEADSLYHATLAASIASEDSAAALAGLAAVLYQNKDYAGALNLYDRLLTFRPLSARYCVGLADDLVRLGRVQEAIAVLKEAVALDPWSEDAHYWLGNGYTDVNYSDLPDRCARAFPDSADTATVKTLAALRSLIARGDVQRSETAVRRFARAHAELAEPWVLLGSLLWSRGASDSAAAAFRQALQRCPLYGRAHNGLAKALEQKRLAADVHAPAYEATFAAALTPRIPDINRFVINYDGLPARIQKRVALSIEPWATFVPVLVASGATFYIKPLYEKLSETPYQASLRNQRIEYDSRLWDDVRGCGGHHTVTGIEDVERTIRGRYNTVLHELTHQVHGVLTPHDARRIQNAYASAKAREAKGTDAFVSRYQASSVWEYFAEGMNSYSTPRRDAYDPRDITRERLAARDTTLVNLITEFSRVTDVEPYYAPALTAAAQDDISNGDLPSAIQKLTDARKRSPDDEAVLVTLSTAFALQANVAGAIELGEEAVRKHPDSADALIALATARYLESGDPGDRLAQLTNGREKVRETDRYRVDQELADTYLAAGFLHDAAEAAKRVLSYQNDNPGALWTLGTTYSLMNNHADARAAFEKALLARSGITRLRMDYAAALLRAERRAAADSQVAESRLLSPSNPFVETIAGWSAWLGGDLAAARTHLDAAAAQAPWLDLAQILRARVWIAVGDNLMGADAMLSGAAQRFEHHVAPSFVYIPEESSWLLAHALPASEMVLVHEGLAELAQKRGNAGAAQREARAARGILHVE